ncbi:MAG: hypothetical protein II375_01900 [Bacteroidales bacterium]|nr:hypothetical protein [Bacteroidales bacterium]
MEDLLRELRHYYVRAFLPTIVFFIACFVATRLTGGQPKLDIGTSSYIMVALLGATFIAFIVTWFILRNAKAKAAESKGDYAPFAKAFKARILCMCVISALSSICYIFTVDSNSVYLVVITMLLVLLYYPSESFIGRQIGSPEGDKQ